MIYPKTKYLKIPMICSASMGIFPQEFMFEKNRNFQRYYAMYSKLVLSLYIFYIITHYISIYKLSSNGNPQVDAISSVLCTSLIYTITLIRQLIIRLHPGLKNILKQIFDSEKIIYAQDDKEVIHIYNDCVKNTNRLSVTYPLTIFFTTMLFFVRPIFLPGYEIQNGNDTILIKSLPLNVWFPIDEQAYYGVTYLWQLIMSFLGAAVVSYTDILMFSLIVYPTVQLKIMQHVLRNFEMYKHKIKNQLKIEDNTAAFVTFKECIQHHKNIIRYVDYFNESMNGLMIFDFLQSSLQIATVLAQIGTQTIPILVVSVVSYIVGMLLRLFMYYHYANEVILLSGCLASSVWDINWYEQPPNVKFMMLFFMKRAQKNLQLKIGPFSVMSLDSLIAILKATYSYITLMYGTN